MALLDKKEPKSTSYGDYLPKNACERKVIKRKQRRKDASEALLIIDIRIHSTSFGGFRKVSWTMLKTHEITPKFDQFPNKH